MRYLLILLLILPFSIFSQTKETEAEPSSFSFGIVPQYAILNGIRVDLDIKLNNKNHWLVIAPQFYISNNANFDWDFNSMTGAGIELQHKIFMKNMPNKRGVYFAYGPVFNFFSVKDDGLTAREFVENGGNYIGLIDEEMTTKIYKTGGNFLVGYQFVIADFLYIDPYVGVGIRFSFDDKTTGLHNYYNEWWGDLGYSGTLMVGGVRIGILL